MPDWRYVGKVGDRGAKTPKKKTCDGFSMGLTLQVKKSDVFGEKLDHELEVRERVTCTRAQTQNSWDDSWDDCEFRSGNKTKEIHYLKDVFWKTCPGDEFPEGIGIVFCAAMFRLMFKTAEQLMQDLRDVQGSKDAKGTIYKWSVMTLEIKQEPPEPLVSFLIFNGYSPDPLLPVPDSGINYSKEQGETEDLQHFHSLCLILSSNGNHTAKSIYEALREDSNAAEDRIYLRNLATGILRLRKNPVSKITIWKMNEDNPTKILDRKIDLDVKLVEKSSAVSLVPLAAAAAVGMGLAAAAKRRYG